MTRSAGRRHRGRELALKVLFELEGTDRNPGDALRYQADDSEAPADVRAFAEELVFGCLRHLDEVDAAVTTASANWRLEDLGKVERAILRLGTYELLFERGTPVAVTVDEAVELAHTYAGDDPARFVNGVLGRIAGELV